jgi:HTH DNA binding domain
LDDPENTPESLYETPSREKDLWFLPGPPEDRAPTDPPWRTEDRRPLFEPRDWLRAEAGQGRGLARAAAAFARLDERLRLAQTGMSLRLALREMTEITWAAGARLPVERLALYEVQRASTMREDGYDLAAASWGLHRLVRGSGTAGGPMADLTRFLGRVRVATDGLENYGTRPAGQRFAELAETWFAVQPAATAAHTLTQSAMAFYSWRAFGLSGPGDVLEGAVVAARIGAQETRGGARFLPVVTGDAAIYRIGGPPAEKLAQWYRAVENACGRALVHLDRLADWQASAGKATADLSGRTPPRLIAALSTTPVLSAEMAATAIGVSRATSLRNLAEFERRGLLREVTGQGRFRFWTARL